MNQNILIKRIIVGIILALFVGIALYLRVFLLYNQVLGGEWVKFTSSDAFYHMRLVDNLIHNFPHFLVFDPYTYFPHGAPVGWTPFFDWLLGGLILVLGLGSPSRHLIDVVSAYFPVILGILTIIPVYFIGKELFNRWVGVIAAGLIAVLPGEFLARSILGHTDHHVAETLFITVFFLFFILAIKAARQRELTIEHIRRFEFAVIRAPIIYCVLAGIFLGIYLLTWVGGLLFILIISCYFVFQFTIDHLKNERTDYLGIVGMVSVFTALVVSLPFMPQTWFSSLFLPSMLIAFIIPVILLVISRFMQIKRIRPAYFILALAGLLLVGLSCFYIISPDLFRSMIKMFRFFNPSSTSLTIAETNPLFFSSGSDSMSFVWSNFTITSFLCLISIGILVYSVIKRRGNAWENLLLFWSLAVILATLGQRRFAYYLTVNVALLTGYLSIILYLLVRTIVDFFRGNTVNYISWQNLEMQSHNDITVNLSEFQNRADKRRAAKKRKNYPKNITKLASIALWSIVVIFLIFYPNVKMAIHNVKTETFIPHDSWYESLLWLKENSPDPMGNSDAYYQLYDSPGKGKPFDYPDSAYGIMAWWDYGHLITRISHRIPVSNPFQQGAVTAAKFFTAPDESAANKIMNDSGAKYIVIDYEVAAVPAIENRVASIMGEFPSIVSWSGQTSSQYYDIFYIPWANQEKFRIFYYPDYYYSLVTRLYCFDAGSVTPSNTIVISYNESELNDGNIYKEVTSMKEFTTYEEAETYISSQNTGDFIIVGNDPFSSPVPLESLKHYKLIHNSNLNVSLPEGVKPDLKIFEYVK
jgi:dolichyl-diphosphooligosaccharide--protein glycosyltransferase